MALYDLSFALGIRVAELAEKMTDDEFLGYLAYSKLAAERRKK
jgi:hypothetical protein